MPVTLILRWSEIYFRGIDSSRFVFFLRRQSAIVFHFSTCLSFLIFSSLLFIIFSFTKTGNPWALNDFRESVFWHGTGTRHFKDFKDFANMESIVWKTQTCDACNRNTSVAFQMTDLNRRTVYELIQLQFLEFKMGSYGKIRFFHEKLYPIATLATVFFYVEKMGFKFQKHWKKFSFTL